MCAVYVHVTVCADANACVFSGVQSLEVKIRYISRLRPTLIFETGFLIELAVHKSSKMI